MGVFGTWVTNIAVAIAIAALWINNQIGGTIGTGGFIQQCQQLIRRSSQATKRIASVLPWLAGLSLVLTTIGLRVDNPAMHMLLFAVFAFWALASFVLVKGLDAIAPHLSFMKGLLQMAGLFSLFMFWLSFMALTGALKWYSWQTSTEIVLFLVFMHVSGILVGSKTPWARWLMEWSIWAVFLTSVIPVTSVPLFKAVSDLTGGLIHRTTVEVNNARRGVSPDKLEDLEPDTYYTTNRSGKFFNCNYCVAVTKTSGGDLFRIIAAKVSLVPQDMKPDIWVAQVPEYPEPVQFHMRTYIVVYWAVENDPDGAFDIDKSKMALIPPDELQQNSPSKPKSGTTALFAALPRGSVAIFGLIAFVVVLAILGCSIAARIRRANTTGNPALPQVANAPAAATPSHGSHGHGSSVDWAPHAWKAVGVAIALLAIWLIRGAILDSHTVQAAPPPPPVVVVSAPAPKPEQTSIVIYDPKYDTTATPKFDTLISDSVNGEYQFVIGANVLQQGLQVVPAMGETWEFVFSDTLVCAYNISCVGPAGQGGKPSGLSGTDRTKYNADDFPAQNAHYQEAVAYVGDDVLELGNGRSWVVTESAAGKPVAVGFNIRRSEIASAHGGGVLTIKIKK